MAAELAPATRKRPSRRLVRSLTQVRNRAFQSCGAQIKEQETYLRRVGEQDSEGGGEAAAFRTAVELGVLLSRMGRRHLLDAGKRRRGSATASADLARRDHPARVLAETVDALLLENDGEKDDGSDLFFIVPATDMLYLSFLDFTEAVAYLNCKCLFIETDLLAFQRTARQSTQSRVEEIQNDPQMTCIFFSNEHCENVSVLPTAGRCEEDRCAIATATAVVWLQRTLDNIASNRSSTYNLTTRARYRAAKLILLTENARLARAARSLGVRHCCTCQELLLTPRLFERAPNCGATSKERLLLLAEELVSEKERKQALAKEKSVETKICDQRRQVGNPLDEPSEYYDEKIVSTGLQEGVLFRGTLDHSAHIPMEAWVNLEPGVWLDAETGERSMARSGSSQHRILIKGRGSINRALHDDVVVVRLLPQELWSMAECGLKLSDNSTRKRRGRTSATHHQQQHGQTNVPGRLAVPSGRVVRVVKPGHRRFVATLQLDAHDIETLELASECISDTTDTGRVDQVVASPFSLSSRERIVLAVPMNRRIPKIRLRTRQLSSLAGQRLVVSLDNWRVGSLYPEGHFVRSLGPAGNLSTEAAALLLRHRLEDHARPFSISALAELPRLADSSIGAEWVVPDSEVCRRRDLRKTRRVVSIDPPGCMDIDDALSVHRLPNGNIEVGVHIADVTAFVAQGSPLDVEALHRGTSVYLVDRRLDMLPGLLSTNLCSLLCGTDRLAMSVLWELQVITDDETVRRNAGSSISFKIIPERTWFGRTIIRSSYALSYGQAQRIIDGKSPGTGNPNVGTPLPRGTCGGDVAAADEHWLRKDITMLRDIGRWLLRQRKAAGAVSFDSTEIKFKLDESTGQPISAKPKSPLEVHSTIEEMMVFANTTVAEKIDNTFPGAALLRRHAEPDPQKAAKLNKILAVLCENDSNRAPSDRMISEDFSANLQKVVDTSKSPAISRLLKSMAVKAMSEAKYFCTGEDTRRPTTRGNDEVGVLSLETQIANARTPHRHYGLGVSLYTHFTSPIRRYADVVVHRLLTAALESAPDKCVPFSTKTMITIARHLNERNRNAKFAGGDSRALFLALHLSQHPEVVDAVVSELRANGFLAYVPKYGIRVPVRIVDENEDPEGRIANTVTLVTGTLKLGTLEGRRGVVDPAGWSVQTVALDKASDAGLSKNRTLQIIAPGGKVWRELAMMDSVRVQLYGDRMSAPGNSRLADIAFRAPKVHAMLVSHVGGNDRSGSTKDATLVHARAAGSKKGHDGAGEKSGRIDGRYTSSHAGKTLSSSPLYTAIASCMDNTPAKLLQSIQDDEAREASTGNGIPGATGNLLGKAKNRGRGGGGESATQMMKVQPWNRLGHHVNGRRQFGGWSSKQPFRVGLGRRSAPPLVLGQLNTGPAQSKAEGIAASQNKLKKIKEDATRRMRKLGTKKRESRRK